MSRSGRWRSEYLVDLNKNQVVGKVLVNVHYYEQGNVKLFTLSMLNCVDNLLGSTSNDSQYIILTTPSCGHISAKFVCFKDTCTD